MQVKTVQYGAGERGRRSRVTRRTGLRPGNFVRRRTRREPLRFWRRYPRASARRRVSPRTARRSGDKVMTPLLSSANWGGQGLHPRGNFEGFVRAASKEKWLEVHGIEHWTHFYTDYGRELQLASSTISCMARRTAGTSSQKCSCKSAIPAKNSSSARKTNGRSRARNGPSSISTLPTMALATKTPRSRRNSNSTAMGEGITFLTAADGAGHRNHRAVGDQVVRLVVHQGCRHFHRAASFHARSERSRVPGRASIRIRRSRKAGCAPRIASSTRSCPRRTGPITPTPKSSRSSPAQTGGA